MKLSYFRNENIGLYFFTNDRVTIAPPALPEKDAEAIGRRLGTKVVRTEVCGSDFIGIYCAGNNNGIIIPEMATKEEAGSIEGVEVFQIRSRANAFGNNIAANSKVALVGPVYNSKEKEAIRDALDVEVIEVDLAGYPTVGSLIRMNDTAFLLGYKAEEEIDHLKEILGMEGKAGSVNMGSPIIKLGCVVNNKAYIAGSACSGVEIGTMEEVFML
ncbi:MAG: translation initiation factor IF-6 [Candidatus Anstonellales archaeon]